MATIITPNMNMAIPVVGVEPGPDWATDLNNALTVVDGHDHSPGNGVIISPAGINISSDLTFNNNNGVAFRTVRMQPQLTAPALPADIGCLEVVGVDLYFNDVNGNNIRITQGGGIVGTPGSISGLVSPATASYNSILAKFIWQSDVNVAASMDSASLTIRKPAVVSSNGITLQVPVSLSTDYALVLPSLPVSKKIMTLDASGNIAGDYDTDNVTLEVSGTSLQIKDSGVTTNKIADATITPPKFGALNFVQSGSSGNYSSAASSYTSVTNLTTAPITVSGVRPVMVFLVPDNSLPANLGSSASGSVGTVDFRLIQGGGTVLGEFETTSTTNVYNIFPGSVMCMDTSVIIGVPGTTTYTLQARANGGAGRLAVVNNCRLIAYEMA